MESDSTSEPRATSSSVASSETTSDPLATSAPGPRSDTAMQAAFSPAFFSSLWPLLRASLRVWLVVVAFWSVLFSLPSMASVHIVVIVGMAVAGVYCRLPPPDEANARAILGDNDNYRISVRETADGLGRISHRACGLDAPENTLAALRLAAKNGANCVEFDMSYTADDVPVVFHDDTLDRTTDGTGKINHITFAELEKLDAAAKHVLKDTFSPERVPTMDEFVDECLKLGLKMIIDLKTFMEADKTTAFIVGLYERKPELYKRAIVSTFFPNLVYKIRSRDPAIVCAMAWRPFFVSLDTYNGIGHDGHPRFDSPLERALATMADPVLDWAVHNLLWHFLGLSAVLVHKDSITMEYARRWRDRGVRLYAWTVNNSLQRAFLADYLGVPSMSDTMDHLPPPLSSDKA